MMRHIFRAAILTVTLYSFSAHSAFITNINNLDIGGTRYNVTFHRFLSFDELFDADGDRAFADSDGALFNRAPTFFSNPGQAFLAASAIIAELGSVDHTVPAGTLPGLGALDSFAVPISPAPQGLYNAYVDDDRSLLVDTAPMIRGDISTRPHLFYPIATFQKIPTPPTVGLIVLALAVMGALGRRRRVC